MSDDKRISVLLADDHAILLDALITLLRQEFHVVGVARDGRMMIDMAKSKKPDVILADISMPHLNGIDAARILRKDVPSARFVFLTMHTDVDLLADVVRLGSSGFVLKTCDSSEITKAIDVVAKGATYISPLLAGELVLNLMTVADTPNGGPLTSRQREVLQLLAEGRTMKEAAATLGISTRTAESHKYEIMRQLGVTRTAALIKHAIRIKLISV